MSGEHDGAGRSRLQDAIRSIRRLQSRVAELEGAAREPIAIVGAGCRFPGKVAGPDDYWRLLENGVDAIGEVPPQRWAVEDWYDPDPGRPGKMYTTAGGFIDGIDLFDADLFGFSPREAAKMDPQHRLVLEVAWEALEHAGLPPRGLGGTATGVYLGITAFDYGLHLSELGGAFIDAYSMTGTKLNFAAGRLAYALGLQGPAYAVDTACSSSLTALHLACQALRRDDCELALAGGVNAMLTPEQTVAECKARMLSPGGRCRTFDAGADGFVRGEGCGILVLERLSRAEREGHPVIALIRGTAVNQDGATSGPTVPNRLAQEAVIRRALGDAGLGPDDIDYVEAHGTGTPLGDPIEVRALANVFRGRQTPLRIGSVKTNFGHLESAAGVAGVLKAALGVQHGVIPPHLNVRTLTPAVDWDRIPVEVATERMPWPGSERPRRAGVSSFGASGTNAHIVIEQAPPAKPAAVSTQRSCHVYPISAASPYSLASTAVRHAAALAGIGDLADACRVAGAGRSHLQHRLAVLGASPDDVRRGLAAFGEGEPSAPFLSGAYTRAPRIAFLLPGRADDLGAAGRDLYRSQPEFRERIDSCGGLARLALPELMFGGDAGELRRPRNAEPALFALQFALAGLWQAFGIVPQVLFGCGTGEYAAACLAGALSVEDAMRLAVARGRLLESLADGGAMAAVEGDVAAAAAAVDAEAQVSIAAINSDDGIVMSGPRADVDRVMAALVRGGARASKLDGAAALHSPLVDGLLDGFAAAVGDIAAGAPRVKLISSVDGAPLPRGALPDLGYWRRQLRDTVQFSRAVRALADDRVDAFLELGPDAAMSRMARRCLPTVRAAWAHSLRTGGDDWGAVSEAIGTLYVAGSAIEWKNVYRGGSGTTVRLPTYAFEHKRHWVDPPPDRKAAGAPAATDTGHRLLGMRLASPLTARQYATTFRPDRPRWLADHKVFGRVVVPATAYLEMLLAAARDTAGPAAVVRDVCIHAAIAVDSEAAVQTLVEPDGDGYRLRIVCARPDGEWTEHVSARAERSGSDVPPVEENLAELATRIAMPVPVDAHYRAMSDSGVDFGPAFRSVGELWRGEAESLGRVRAAEGVSLDPEDGCWLHPALLDGCLQVAREALPDAAREQRRGALVPMQVATFSVHRRPAGTLVCHARLVKKPLPAGTYELALNMVDESGVPIATIEGLRLARLERSKITAAQPVDAEPDTYRVEWLPKPCEPRAAAVAADTRWLVFAYEDELAHRCAAELRRDYGRVQVVRASRRLAIRDDGDSTVRVGEPGDFRQVVAATVGSGGPWVVVHAGGSIAGAEPDERAVRDAQSLYLQSLLHTAQALEASAAGAKLVVLTHAAQGSSAVSGLPAASLWGFGRVLQNELPRLGTLLLDLQDPAAAPGQLAAEAGAGDGENQVLYRDGERHAARLRAAPGEAGRDAAPPTGPSRLVLDTPGLPDSLALSPMTRQAPGPGEIEIEVSAAGLNFRDVLVALGVYQGPAGPLGGECAGTVVATGEGVDTFDAGDRVFAFATGSMASHVVTDARLAWRTPAALADADAATLPIAFLTAAWCLDRVARLSRGDRVLIHGAAGGVGMAAVQLARRAGAEIFGTAGSDAKRALIRSLGVQHALDSRSLDFADEVLRLTGGEGVDVVLNSLAGEFIPASLRAAARRARFVEIGRTDIWSPEDVARVRPDIEYRTVLLGDVCESDPALIQEIGASLFADVAEGRLSALPRRTWPMRRAADAFRLMARAGHTGKLVLVNDSAAVAVRADGAYLVTGGFGGLGLELARWLAAQGAGTIALLGRRAADARAQAVIDELSATGATVLALTADVTDEAQLRRALTDIDGAERPLRGVFHAAGTLDDGIVAEQTWQRVQSVLNAKVTGALLLHRLTADSPLDLFVLFSSASAIFGAAGQGGYAAGNAFLDALARWRAERGLPALSINWGPWSDAGMFAESGEAGRRAVLERGFRSLPAERNFAAMQALLERRVAEAGVFAVDWAAYRAAREDGAPLAAELSRPSASPAPERGAFAAELARVPAPKRRQFLRDRIRAEVAGVLGNTADAIRTSLGFREQGMDSLMSVELRNRLERLLARPFVSTLAFDHPNVEALADHVLSEMFAPGDREAPPATSPPRDEIAAEVAELTDEEAEELLALELQRMSQADGRA